MMEQIRKIKIYVDSGQATAELKKISTSLKSMTNDISKMSSNMDMAKTLFAGFVSSQVIRSFTNMADSMQLLNDRIKSLLGTQEQATYAMGKLYTIAQSTNAPIDELAGTFARVAVATKSLGLSSQAMLDITQVLQNSFRLSGATTEESVASTIQFAQALSFGALRGQELRSVLSQNATLANVFREAIKGSGMDIYKFAEAGKFTTKFVLTALAKNMDEINTKAGELGQTFAQTMVKALNEVKVKIGELNAEFNLNSKFAVAMQWIVDNAATIGAVLAGIATAFTVVKVSAALAGVTLAGIASVVFSIPAAIGAAVASLILLYNNFDSVSKFFERFKLTVQESLLELQIYVMGLEDRFRKFFNLKTEANSFSTYLTGELNKVRTAKEKLDIAFTTTEMEDYYSNMKKVTRGAMGEVGGLKDEVNKLKDTAPKLTIDQQISALNEKFNLGRISVEKYNKEILRLTEIKFDKASPERLAKELEKVKIGNLTRDFEEGTLKLKDYQKAMNEIRMDKLRKDFDSAKIGAAEFYTKMSELGAEFSSRGALALGADSYIKKIGTTTTMVASLIEGTFDKLGDSLSNWIKTGKFSFKEFTMSILDDLNKIIVRAMIIRPLANALLDTAGVKAAANGFAPNGSGVSMFASGGIVSGATAFSYGGSRMGIMGEAGPEAILPLRRDASGKLGVSASAQQNPVIVNIVNNSSAEVTQRETTGANGSKVLEVMINSKVKEGIASGAFDKSMQAAYGLRRKGN
jgi:tape measure domain-containing protein